MCAHITKESSQIFIKKLGKRKTFVGYKVLHSPNTSIFTKFKYKPGENIALNSKGKQWKGNYSRHNPRGIHVYISISDAINSFFEGTERKRVQVICNIKDFVGASSTQAVFRKVTIRKEQLR